jgi:hypothetical protein
LICKGDKIKVVIEIEESDKKPTHICGKFLTTALSKYYIRKEETKEMSDSILFIQIVDTSRLPDKSKKPGQWEKLESSINKLLAYIKEIINIKKYIVLCGNQTQELLEEIRNFMQ